MFTECRSKLTGGKKKERRKRDGHHKESHKAWFSGRIISRNSFQTYHITKPLLLAALDFSLQAFSFHTLRLLAF
jgi:hypothetical protein